MSTGPTSIPVNPIDRCTLHWCSISIVGSIMLTVFGEYHFLLVLLQKEHRPIKLLLDVHSLHNSSSLLVVAT